jgi:hypothetical protein
MQTRKTEFLKLINKLREFEDEVAPASSEIKEYFMKEYNEDLKKKPKFFGIL